MTTSELLARVPATTLAAVLARRDYVITVPRPEQKEPPR